MKNYILEIKKLNKNIDNLNKKNDYVLIFKTNNLTKFDISSIINFNNINNNIELDDYGILKSLDNNYHIFENHMITLIPKNYILIDSDTTINNIHSTTWVNGKLIFNLSKFKYL